jgi:serine/arginine repetitive matrix protein 1
MKRPDLYCDNFKDEVKISSLKAVAAAAGAPATPPAMSAQEELKTAPEPKKETESEAEDNLDDLEKHLREKALRSMRKAQVSPQS